MRRLASSRWPPPTGYQDDPGTMAKWTRASRAAHPVVAHLRRAYHVWTDATRGDDRALAQPLAAKRLAAGKGPDRATTSSLAIVGLVEEEALLRGMARPMPRRCPGCRMLDVRRVRMADAAFNSVVRSLIEGLRITAGADRTPRFCADNTIPILSMRYSPGGRRRSEMENAAQQPSPHWRCQLGRLLGWRAPARCRRIDFIDRRLPAAVAGLAQRGVLRRTSSGSRGRR